MEMNGSHRIPAKRETVWEALNDPEILKECIPGCESLEKTSDTEMTAAVTSKIGPVKAKFKGAVTLENMNPPESYTIAGEGKGGVAGFAKGSADVKLTEDGDGTILTYDAKAQVGGKLAQLGSRLIDSTARKMAEEFFTKFSEKVGGGADASPVAAGTTHPVDPVEPAPVAASVETVSPDETVALENQELDEGVAEEAKRIAIEDTEHAVEERFQQAEENLEVAAGRNVFGGPMVWGLLLLGAVIVVLALAS
ncbi:carbon monoxide dehydrogenase subunit G [Rhodobacterales bacterium]|nr:carbon monoxide dehydrogenase subunit G [Rhodobacterales bacterium]